MLRSLRARVRESATPKGVVKVLSSHVRNATTGRCTAPLLLTIDNVSDAYECETRTQHPLFVSDMYVRLRTVEGCDLSVVGLGHEEGEEEYVLTSDTVPTQQRKGYNALLRAVAVMVAHVLRVPLRSDVANAWSAYSLLKDYQTTGVRRDGTRETLDRLSREEAAARKSLYRTLYVRPTVANLDFATRLFADATVRCA